MPCKPENICIGHRNLLLKESEHMTWYVVYLCGPTDCFVHAAFVEEKAAKEWGIKHGQRCDGYMIKEMTGEELAQLEEDYS